MRFLKSPTPFLLGLALAAAALPASAAAPIDSKLQPCKLSGEEGEVDARCGVYQVWENTGSGFGVADLAGRTTTFRPILRPDFAARFSQT